jgi:hypothetical protein
MNIQSDVVFKPGISGLNFTNALKNCYDVSSVIKKVRGLTEKLVYLPNLTARNFSLNKLTLCLD